MKTSRAFTLTHALRVTGSYIKTVSNETVFLCVWIGSYPFFIVKKWKNHNDYNDGGVILLAIT